MLELALWLKRNGFRADQVQAFLPSPMATATAMYHSGKNPLRKVTPDSEDVHIPKGLRSAGCTRRSCATTIPTTGRCCARRCGSMGRADLIGNGRQQLVPTYQPIGTGQAHEGKRKARPASAASSRPATPTAAPRRSSVSVAAAAPVQQPFRTQHTGLPQTPSRPPRRNRTRKSRG